MASARGAPEAVEDARAVLKRNARAVVAYRDLAAAHAHLHRRAGRAPFRGVVHEVRHRAEDPRAHAAHARLGRLHDDTHLGVPEAHRVGGLGGDLVEAHVLDRERRLLVAREVDEVGDERREPLHLRHEVVEQLRAIVFVGRLPALEELEVRAQARERRAQLVRRVGDELALRAERHLERGEHPIEAAREPPELVVRARADAAREVARARHLFDGLPQARDRREHGPRDERAERGGDEDTRERDLDEAHPGLGERAVHVLERPRELERDAAAERRHVDAHADVPRLGGRIERLPLPRRDLAHLGRDERGDRLAEVGADDAARGVDELAEDVLSPGDELRRSSERRAPVVRARTAQDRPGGLGEGAVHLARELVLHDDVDRDRSADRGDRDGHRDERRHAKPEAHASLST